MISDRLGALAKALVAMREKIPWLIVEVPVRLCNTSNSRDGWRATAKSAKIVRTFARAAVGSRILRSVLVKGSRFGTTDLPFPCSVRLVYIGPRQLDDDGVVSAVKSLRDGVADALGVDDRDPRVVWVPDQERGGVREYSARVEVYLG